MVGGAEGAVGQADRDGGAFRWLRHSFHNVMQALVKRPINAGGDAFCLCQQLRWKKGEPFDESHEDEPRGLSVRKRAMAAAEFDLELSRDCR